MIPEPAYASWTARPIPLRRHRQIVFEDDGARTVALQLQEGLTRLGAACTLKGPASVEASGEPIIGLVLDEPENQIAQHPEGYAVSLSQDRIEVIARRPRGLFYGVQSLLAEATERGTWREGRIADAPRYRWRGAHLDVARHFFSVPCVKRFIDLLAMHKMNVFHWHLTDDQGWRIEIESHPRLMELAAWRMPPDQDPLTERVGGFYTKEEIREIVRYAESRFVEVVPEIEMPGHARAALAAYPELSCAKGPFDVPCEWGIFEDVYCAGSEQVWEFLRDVVSEVVELFPSPFFHVGGDECPKKRWQACAECQRRMREEGLANEEELQAWFVGRMGRFLADRGRRLVGWDEILEGGLPPGATVMSWRGTEGGVKAARMGHDVVMTPTHHCYLDYKQSDEEREPGAWFAKPLTLRKAYEYDPTPADFSEQEAQRVLGVQANVWTERMPTFERVEYMTFPRLCALSEVAWSSRERDFEDFERRLARHMKLLDARSVAYRGSGRVRDCVNGDPRRRFACNGDEATADSPLNTGAGAARGGPL